MHARLHFLSGALKGRELPLREPETRIGRESGLDVVIPPPDDRYVSRVHASIALERGTYRLDDHGSTNGTLVNGRPVERAVLADGDEIQFGRSGPVARFLCGPQDVATVPVHRAAALPDSGDAPTVIGGARPGRPMADAGMPRTPSRPSRGTAPPDAGGERPSQLVRRLVGDAMAASTRRSSRHIVMAAFGAALAAVVAVTAAGRFGLWGGAAEDTLQRHAELLMDRVVLVEVGLQLGERYATLGHGSGFVAAEGGLIVTNKHVVHPHRYAEDAACVAAAFARAGRSLEEELVTTVWLGGTQFRQTPTGPGDRGLGYSTEHGTLSVVGVASDNLLPAEMIACPSLFGQRPFQHRWQKHAQDNNDLAVLRASDSLAPIPLRTTPLEARAPVMAYGFPIGLAPLETSDAEPIARFGRVLRVQDSIQIDAVVLPGNSGGPLIDEDGRVAGVIARGASGLLNMAIKVEHAERLLNRARNAEP